MEPDSDLIRIRSSNSKDVLLNPGALAAAIREANLSPAQETGGILLGRFLRAETTPIICKCLASTSDSLHGRASFVRGTHGLAAILTREFERGYQYIGEWHTHPDGLSQPSCRDHVTMVRIAHSTSYHITNPLLMILSGSERTGWTASIHSYDKVGGAERFAQIDATKAVSQYEL